MRRKLLAAAVVLSAVGGAVLGVLAPPVAFGSSTTVTVNRGWSTQAGDNPLHEFASPQY